MVGSEGTKLESWKKRTCVREEGSKYRRNAEEARGRTDKRFFTCVYTRRKQIRRRKDKNLKYEVYYM